MSHEISFLPDHKRRAIGDKDITDRFGDFRLKSRGNVNNYSPFRGLFSILKKLGTDRVLLSLTALV